LTFWSSQALVTIFTQVREGVLPLVDQWKVYDWCKHGHSFARRTAVIGANTLATSPFWLCKQAVWFTFRDTLLVLPLGAATLGQTEGSSRLAFSCLVLIFINSGVG
jgi:hypothetical protein